MEKFCYKTMKWHKLSIMNKLFAVLFTLLTAFSLCCESAKDKGSTVQPDQVINNIEEFSLYGDKIKFVSVDPKNTLLDGTDYTFEVAVAYELITIGSARLDIGFNTDNISLYTLVAGAEKIVSGSKGEHLFSVTITARDWGSTGSFKVYVQLSEDQGGTPSIPLGYSTMVLNFN